MIVGNLKVEPEEEENLSVEEIEEELLKDAEMQVIARDEAATEAGGDFVFVNPEWFGDGVWV